MSVQAESSALKKREAAPSNRGSAQKSAKHLAGPTSGPHSHQNTANQHRHSKYSSRSSFSLHNTSQYINEFKAKYQTNKKQADATGGVGAAANGTSKMSKTSNTNPGKRRALPKNNPPSMPNARLRTPSPKNVKRNASNNRISGNKLNELCEQVSNQKNMNVFNYLGQQKSSQHGVSSNVKRQVIQGDSKSPANP